MKVRRSRNNWVNVLYQVGNEEMFRYFFDLQRRLHRGKMISPNRAAYNTLKHYYSTTTIGNLVLKIEESKVGFAARVRAFTPVED